MSNEFIIKLIKERCEEAAKEGKGELKTNIDICKIQQKTRIC